jgi:hypothetical protein
MRGVNLYGLVATAAKAIPTSSLSSSASFFFLFFVFLFCCLSLLCSFGSYYPLISWLTFALLLRLWCCVAMSMSMPAREHWKILARGLA